MMQLANKSAHLQGETPRNEVAAASMMEQNMLDENHLHFYRVVLLRGDTIPCEATSLCSLDPCCPFVVALSLSAAV